MLANVMKWALHPLHALYTNYKLKRELSNRFPAVRFMPGATALLDCSFEDNIVIHSNSRLSATKVGRRTYIGHDCIIHNSVIGRYCSIGAELRCGLGRHPSQGFVSTYPAFFSAANSGCQASFVNEQLFDEYETITIGNDVWVGARVLIMDGVAIGNGAIIGAGSVVTKDVPDYAIVGGVPAKIIRYRFEPDEIDFLLKHAWWNRDESWIIKSAPYFNDIGLLKKLTEEVSVNN